MTKRELTSEEKEIISKNFPRLEQEVRDLDYQLESAKLLLSKGIDFRARKDKETVRGQMLVLDKQKEEVTFSIKVCREQLRDGVEIKKEERKDD